MTKAKSDPRGHRAAAPSEMPARAWKDIALRTYKRTWDDNVALVSAGVAFYGFFALLSLLGLIVIAYGFFAEATTVIAHMSSLTSVLPTQIAVLIGDQLLRAVDASGKAKGFALAIAIAVAFYGGTNGAVAVITSLNIAYEEKEKRSLVRFYLLALGMTAAALVGALVAIAGTAALAYLQHLLPQASPVVIIVGKASGYLLLLVVGSAIAATLYRYGPSRENAKWRWITPGSAFTSLAWMLLTLAFGFYVTRFTNYEASYGPLGAVVALLTWMYLSAYAFVFGAELNSEIEHQTAIDSTTGSPRPLGKRGAWAADNVASDDTVQDRPEEAREGEKLTQAAPKVADEKG
ncbi:YihY/virulence factor BrkB family protein [Sphingomonas sp.]|uniref:YihY/virulence factor BrkB family protein n=1 Tax=Sphingomonas sp. TaxID=28214 RepID=UPI0025F191BF|nr:YihY/virulence factor BrkB family protein [Sphingomonas sp.]MBV9529148.1 YihY/virulence factor BrkB family protein [Sphingomonas sp.]